MGEASGYEATTAVAQTTWAAYVLLLLAVATTIGFCLLFGAGWFSLVIDSLPSDEQRGVELPDEDFVSLPKVQELLGFLIYGIAILPGLAVFYAGQWLLQRLGIPIWVQSENEKTSAT